MPKRKLRFKFDPDQDFQLQAIDSVVQVFDGLPRFTSDFALGEDTVANLPRYETLEEGWLANNVSAVQERNGVEQPMFLDVDEGLVLDGAGFDSWRFPSFTIEMETGTGKTYVYLRTIHELRKHYGFRKFIIVVPSIAIYEGVVKSFQITKSHFASLYHNETVNLVRYDGSRLNSLRAFVSSTFVEILVMTIASFNSKRNTIYRASEQLPGERLPYQYIQDTRPILILDEPQNMETERAKAALRTLKPLFALRYSATHRTTPNLLYRLAPFDAYRLNLVKRIQVDGVTEQDNFNRPFLALESIVRQKNPGIRAIVRTYVNDKGRTREDTVTLAHGDDLYAKTKRETHRHGYRVTEINVKDYFVDFQNGLRLQRDDVFGPTRIDIFRVQIERTIEQHMQTQEALLDKGIKVLSLFFIDRVANYVEDEGIIKHLFDEAFDRIKTRFPYFQRYAAHQVRDGYFAKRKRKGTVEEEAFDTSGRTVAQRKAEKATFALIMRNKEQLLSFEEPVCFIFAHSALKEGWDNPNVFQICTLNQTVSEMKKRQEIGRGLRIAVNQEGERVFDDEVNVLTVVANQSYQRYVSLLQAQYVEDGQMPPPNPSRVGRSTVTRNDALFQSKHFRDFWRKLSKLTKYQIDVDTPTLIECCVERLNNKKFPDPVIVVERGQYVVTQFTLTLESVAGTKAKIRIDTELTTGERSTYTGFYTAKDDLAKRHKDDRFRGLRVQEIIDDGEDSKVVFANGVELELNAPYVFSSEQGQVPLERAQLAPEHKYPVFNLLDRAARETGLTRPTINRILRGMSDRKKQHLLKNPKGFANVFLSEIRFELAAHIVERLEFTLDHGQARYVLDELFPATKTFPQNELVDAGETSLYDRVQIDSDVERSFVDFRLMPDPKVIGYFKFPPAFRIPFPKIVGKYNPDWGILRYSDDGRVVLQLVRETKGREEADELRFPHERRKIDAARKHFRRIGIDYRPITDRTLAWWRPEEGESQPLGI